MTIAREAKLDHGAVKALTKKICNMLHGSRKPDCEIALLSAYCQVADGVQQFPSERQRRASLVISLGSAALCQVIEQVGALSDDEVALATLEQTPTNSSCVH